MKNTNHKNGDYSAAPKLVQPAGWDDDDLEVILAFRVNEWSGKPHQFNSLYYDNRGRFFLVSTSRKLSDPLDLPGTAFNEVSFQDACHWSLEINQRWTGSEGDFAPLVSHAMKVLGRSHQPNIEMPSLLQSN